MLQRIAGYRSGESRPKHQYAPHIRPNTDSTINLVTLGTACFLHVQPNNLAAHGFNGIATFGKMHAVIRDDVDAEDPPS